MYIFILVLCKRKNKKKKKEKKETRKKRKKEKRKQEKRKRRVISLTASGLILVPSSIQLIAGPGLQQFLLSNEGHQCKT